MQREVVERVEAGGARRGRPPARPAIIAIYGGTLTEVEPFAKHGNGVMVVRLKTSTGHMTRCDNPVAYPREEDLQRTKATPSSQPIALFSLLDPLYEEQIHPRYFQRFGAVPIECSRISEM
jgi:hypothetical protein